MTHSFFVTGTDTGVGKTLIAAALAHALAARGLKVAGMKPVASGSAMTPEGLRNEDALALMAQTNIPTAYEHVNPYCFAPAIAPHIAAADANTTIDPALLHSAHTLLAAQADRVVVEGAGGWLTPLNDHDTLADFARLIRARVILVVGLRLGCINHTLLTARAIHSDGLELAGWIANTIDPDMPRAAENIHTLQQRLPAPLLGVIPYDPTLTSQQVARLLSDEF